MKWLLRAAALLALLGVAWVAARIGLAQLLSAPGPASVPVTVVLPKGTSTVEIGRHLAQAGTIDHAALFPYLVKLSGREALQAGEYAFPAHASLTQILDQMRHGQVVVHKLTIAEGLTVAQIQNLLRDAPALSGTAETAPPEGSLLPTTYFYSYGDDREMLLARMQKAMSDALDDLWAKRAPDPLIATKEQAIILASIVERETAISEERPHVAAIFLNRLRAHMRLQTDPSVIYGLSLGLGVLDHPLTRADLATPTPYNSYLNDGLPPGAICNPGIASIRAVLHPDDSRDLYFVADGSGGHVFAASLADHNQNVARLRRIEQGTALPPLQKKVKSAQ